KQRACRYEALLVGERDAGPPLHRRQRWRKPGSTDNTRHDPVRREICGIDNRLTASSSLDSGTGETFLQRSVERIIRDDRNLRPMEPRVFHQRLNIAVRRQRNEIEAV